MLEAENLQVLHDVNMTSVAFRLLLATICGGIIGIEPGKQNKAAGIRTYMLVCVGACLTMVTNQYITDVLGKGGDPTRMAAQVISGIGFLGAGTIIVTRKSQVKGLTTAAGLWASACMGLAIGVGFYEGALLGFAYILGIVTVFKKIDRVFYKNKKVIEVYIEVENIKAVKNVIRHFQEKEEKMRILEVLKPKATTDQQVGLVIAMTRPKRQPREITRESLKLIQGVTFVELLTW